MTKLVNSTQQQNSETLRVRTMITMMMMMMTMMTMMTMMKMMTMKDIIKIIKMMTMMMMMIMTMMMTTIINMINMGTEKTMIMMMTTTMMTTMMKTMMMTNSIGTNTENGNNGKNSKSTKRIGLTMTSLAVANQGRNQKLASSLRLQTILAYLLSLMRSTFETLRSMIWKKMSAQQNNSGRLEIVRRINSVVRTANR